MIRGNFFSLILLFLFVLGCSPKVELKVHYPFLDLSSFETLEDIDDKVFKLTGKHCNLVDDMDIKSCSFDFISTDSISSHCFMQFNGSNELIWFQCWYRTKNNDLGYLHEWFTTYYRHDTLSKESDPVIEIVEKDQTYHVQVPNKNSKVLYFGQFFTDEIPIGD